MRLPFSKKPSGSPERAPDGPGPEGIQIDPLESIVSFYAGGKQPFEEVRGQLTVQYKDPVIVESLMKRINARRLKRENIL